MGEVLGHLRLLETAIKEESRKTGVLLPFIEEIDVALNNENYSVALHLIDELEEFMDIEFLV